MEDFIGVIMVAQREQAMGRFSVEVELSNYGDVVLAKQGHLPAAQVRRMRVRGVVDTGAARLVIPAAVSRQLGVETSGSAKVRYADGRTADREIARDVHLSYGGRGSVFSAVVEPDRESALIGAIVLEELDFVADCTTGRLAPRDPKQIVSEVE